jgi:outer membrane protein insertion porin family
MNYLNFKVDVIIKIAKGKQNKVNLVFKCEEGSRLRLKEVDFDGCHNVLKSAMAEKLYTKEDWLLSPINGAGKFNWELLEIDKSNIQRYYMDRGYYKAGVIDTVIDKNEKTNDVSVKFVIEEGEVHKVRFVDVPSDEIYKQEFLERQMLLAKGDVFSTSKLVSSMDRIKNLFGINGYVFCNVYPDVTPVVVDGEMFVDIKINVDKGLVYKINEIRIFGNFKTREYVIRRELLVKEGGLANKVAMDSSLIRIEALGYFDRNLDWKITKISEDQVDLELQVKEVKTGSGNIGLTMSPDKGSNNATVKFAAEIKKRNFNGLGWDLGGSLACGKDSLQKVDFDFRIPNCL